VAIEDLQLKTIFDRDGAAILDIERGLLSTLNATGSYVWQGLQRGESLEIIIAGLACETGEESILVERDVREFVEDLKQMRLLPK
jgi:hypothetical protein